MQIFKHEMILEKIQNPSKHFMFHDLNISFCHFLDKTYISWTFFYIDIRKNENVGYIT